MLTPRGRLIALASAAVALAAALALALLPHGAPQAPVPATARAVGDVLSPATAGAETPRAADDRGRKEVAAALAAAVRRADALGGRTTAAVLADGWSAPVTAGPAGLRGRMWSMSKPVAAVAALTATRGRAPSEELWTAMQHAIARSENCAQRRVVLGLQLLAGGPARARAAVSDVLARAGAEHAVVARATMPPDPICSAYLQASSLRDPQAAALTLGVSRWTVTDAVRFGAALGAGRYGQPGRRVLALMRLPKRPSGELASAAEYTPDPAWGAGRALRGLRPAYKAGWGGALQRSFLAGQLAVVHAGSRPVAIAVVFRPSAQPPIDDPGRTPAPEAIETVLRGVRGSLGAVRR